jgi:hypothetical protein
MESSSEVILMSIMIAKFYRLLANTINQRMAYEMISKRTTRA